MLSKYKFKKYYFENLSYLEQIRLCYNSKIIIGVQGSGLANLIFMKKNSNLIEMTNSFIKNPIMQLLCKINKINYFNVPFSVNNLDLTGLVNVDLIEKKLLSILKKNYL
jgi:capsular polysaccharide biosynthesis protein